MNVWIFTALFLFGVFLHTHVLPHVHDVVVVVVVVVVVDVVDAVLAVADVDVLLIVVVRGCDFCGACLVLVEVVAAVIDAVKPLAEPVIQPEIERVIIFDEAKIEEQPIRTSIIKRTPVIQSILDDRNSSQTHLDLDSETKPPSTIETIIEEDQPQTDFFGTEFTRIKRDKLKERRSTIKGSISDLEVPTFLRKTMD